MSFDVRNISSLLKTYFGDERVLFITKILSEKKFHASLQGLAGSAVSFIIRAVAEKKHGIHLIVAQDKEQAAYLLNDFETLLPSPLEEEQGLPAGQAGVRHKVLFFPSSFHKPFHTEETDISSIQLRAGVLNAVRANSKLPDPALQLIVSYPEAIAEKVISKEYLEKNSIEIIKGEKISMLFLTDLLNEYGFERSDFVIEPGQFSIRGGIADIYSFANKLPLRIEFSGDEVESIRTFDTANQLTLQHVDCASILPDISAIGQMLTNTEQKKLSEGKAISIIDYVLENKKNLSLWIYNQAQAINAVCGSPPLVRSRVLGARAPYYIGEEKERELITEKSELFLNAKEIRNCFEKVPVIEFSGNHADAVNFDFSPQPDFSKNFDLLFSDLKKKSSDGYRILILFNNEKQKERLHAIYESIFSSESTELFQEDMGELHEGFIDHHNKIVCYTDHQIFGRYHHYKLSDSGYKKNEAITLKMIKSLQPGDYVTHIDYGIGRFGGLEKISIPSSAGEDIGISCQQEAIRLVYKDNDVLYISIHSLHQISKYAGKEGEIPKLDKLGSNTWENLKRRTKKKVKEIAIDLIKLYAERKAKKGFAFSTDNYLQNELEASFIYEDTPDQIKSTTDIKRDMESESPMDRLICGDVGFGKTEIAIRAAFKAACDGKQTALLVPTTILALQHHKTFSERMKELPCTIDYINRFKSGKEQKESLKKLAEGKTDIIIGTHRLLGKDVKFKDLGLLIVDEEQKFGVAAKEKLRHIKANVDTLALTATPIPRTLQFSMMGARDLSVINTPPPNRCPIHTEVHQFNEKIIKDGIERELHRGGQVFFVHNRVQDIGQYDKLIAKNCSKARILVVHGQMKGEKLEKAMLGFIEGGYDVLVCTTIIESGLDIPNVNTIFINDAQNYGLSDLYQLRGRVGRSNKKAFCYLLTPPFSTLTNEARKRLRAIEEFTDLGSGINIALRDLDIRGAGNLLGAEQSGFITEIGYEMYQKILDEAMMELREEVSSMQYAVDNETAGSRNHEAGSFVHDCQIDTDFEIFISDEYVENITERIALYQQLDNSKTEDDLLVFEKQLQDRFGSIPDQTKKLISIVRLRWLAVQLGFEKIVLKNGKLIAWFVSNKNSPYYQSETFSKILQFVHSNSKICTMKQGEEKLSLTIENIKDIREAMEEIKKMKS